MLVSKETRKLARLKKECDRAFAAYQETKDNESSIPVCDRAFAAYEEARAAFVAFYALLYSDRAPTEESEEIVRGIHEALVRDDRFLPDCVHAGNDVCPVCATIAQAIEDTNGNRTD